MLLMVTNHNIVTGTEPSTRSDVCRLRSFSFFAGVLWLYMTHKLSTKMSVPVAKQMLCL